MALWSATGCSSAPPAPAIDRIVFLRVDDLSGGSDNGWATLAIPVIAASQLAGVGNIVPIRADNAGDAAAKGATRLVHGRMESAGTGLSYSFSIEDLATHEMQTVTASGTVLDGATALAKAISPDARPFSSTNPEAVEAWGRRKFSEATAIDPDFGAAWYDWAQAEATPGQPGNARNIVLRALERPTLRNEIDRARLELSAAQMDQDQEAVAKAGLHLSTLLPKDATLARGTADLLSNSRRFTEAIELYKRAIEVEPDQTAVWNGLGYAQFFAGDLKSARESFQKYGQDPTQAANAADSEGEVLFMAGQFKEAETLFRKAHELNADLMKGADLMKAAYARWLGGDLEGADQVFGEFIKYRLDILHDVLTGWRQAVWFYATGRAEQAVAELQKLQGDAAQLGQQQLIVWSNPGQLDRPVEVLEPLYQTRSPNTDGLYRTLYARALWRADREEEAAKVAELWPLPIDDEPMLQGFLYPAYQELKKALAKGGTAKAK